MLNIMIIFVVDLDFLLKCDDCRCESGIVKSMVFFLFVRGIVCLFGCGLYEYII